MPDARAGAVVSMLHRTMAAEAHAVRVSRRGRRMGRRHRAWRRRSRRAQVAPVATILGLLLVVTFIASYLSTTLPNQMSQNDLQHEVQVQNQLAQLSALLQATAKHGSVGAQVSQPISLGSAGSPPFAGQDGSSVTAMPNGSALSTQFALIGPLRLPYQGVPNQGSSPGCSNTTTGGKVTGISCTGSASVVWNFTAGNNVTYSVGGTGGFHLIANFTTNYSLISAHAKGGTGNAVAIFGGHNTIYVDATGGATMAVLLFGSNNTMFLNATGGATLLAFVVGNYDSITMNMNGASSSAVLAGYGGYDSYTDNNAHSTVYWTGFNLDNPNFQLCPYANIANTDKVYGTGGNVYYNNTNSTNTNGTVSGWTYHYSNPNFSACPFVVTQSLSQGGIVSGFVVSLHNTYAPAAEVAFDQGSVVYAQPGGVPIFIATPSITFSHNVANVVITKFQGLVNGESGVGTAGVSLRLLSDLRLTLPSGGFHLANNSVLTLSITSPYWAAWWSYFSTSPTMSSFATCTLSGAACPSLTSAAAAYYPGQALGTVVLRFPSTTTALNMVYAVYGFTLW